MNVKEVLRQKLPFFYNKNELAQLFDLLENPPPFTPPETPVTWKMPEVDFAVRNLVVAGVLSIDTIKTIFENPDVKKTVSNFIFIENDKAVIGHLLQQEAFVHLLHDNYVRFIFLKDEKTLGPALFNILKQPNFSTVMKCSSYTWNQGEDDKEIADFYSKIFSIFEETLFHVLHNYGQIDDSMIGLKQSWMNLERFVDLPGLEQLKGLYKGMPALVVGAGPTLDDDIELLKSHANKFVIITVDAGLKPLLAAGIEPHFVACIERNNKQRPFFEGTGPLQTELVAYPIVHPEVLDSYLGPIRAVYRNYSYFAYNQKSYPKGMLHSGGSSAGMALRIALLLGCESITTLGIDNAYREVEPGLFRSHCLNTGYPEWGDLHPIEFFTTERQHHPAFKELANDGSEVYTNLTYWQWAKEIGEEIFQADLEGRFFHTAAKGVKIPSATYKPLNEVVAELAVLDIPRPARDRAIYYRKLDHKDLLKNLKGWLQLSEGFRELIDDLETTEENAKMVAMVYQSDKALFLDDTLFVSFIIQNCAAEFYTNDNQWNSIPGGITSQVTTRLHILRGRFDLYNEVLTKAIQAIEEGQSYVRSTKAI